MSRSTKIIIYSILLFVAFIYKYGEFLGDIQSNITPQSQTSPKRIRPSKTTPTKTINDLPKISEFAPDRVKPSNGNSPYDALYGSGVYHSTQNSILVTAPEQSDLVFLLKDLRSNRFIRNEFIRAGTKFNLTKIPYGRYKFYYSYGKGWSNLAPFKKGAAKGNFTIGKGVSKSDDRIDFEFENGYKGSYTLKLQMIENGNLSTEEASEDEL
tara:strand:- start:1311 stop:1943 length:633 start_codon:yes stop_codon:yes gene_type:complete